MEVDQFGLSRHDKWKGLSQPYLGAGLANELFQVRVGPHVIRKCLTLPSRNFGPYEERYSGIVTFRHMDTVVGVDTCERGTTSSESAPRPLYGVFLVKKFMQSGTSFFIRQFLCSI
jgi:hypothetical protein